MSIEQTIRLEAVLDNTQAMGKAKELNNELNKISMPRKPAQAAYAAAEKASGQGESKTARSVGANGGTGSATSDFAAQAQGLGGLVHLYATFAANIFAVSAAFSALSKAMDVTNLVKGLDQIGASTGRNLGSLAKQMVAVTGGAISMQQAMTSTAMASSGGMTNQAILRMTEVAKKASLALGRDMTDSMDRLTKGIVKTQPELLDELGIMTRMIPAQQEYARQIGKTIGSLTDFEKRQAFANAVLAEGERKFGAIAMDTNPYSKISASITNLVQSGLELVNKVLGPLLNMLSQSPVGLSAVLGVIAATLLKQAIPAIGMFRENAKRMETETRDRVTRQVKEQEAAAIASDAIVSAKAAREFQVAETTAKKIAELPKTFNKKIVGEEVRGLLSKSPYDLSNKDMELIKAKHIELASSTNTIYQTQAEKVKARYDANLALQKASLDAGYNATVVQIDKDEKAWTHASMKKRELDKLTRKAAVSSILSNVADMAAVQGPSMAFQTLRKETSELDAGRVTKYATLVKGSFSIITSAVSTAVNAFGVWGQVIALLVTAFNMFDSWASKSAKQSEAFAGSIDTLKSSFDNIDRTLDVISKKDLKDFISVESIQARATAFGDLTGNVSAAVDKFTKLQETQNGWDKFFDGFWDMFGKGSGDKLALGISSSVINAMRLMSEGPAKEEAKKRIASLFDLPDNVNFDSIEKFNASLKDLDKVVVGSKVKEISKILDDSSRSANNAATSLTAFKTALGEIDKQATVISNSLMPVDDISKMGIALNSAASSMATSLQDPITGLTALRELAGDMRSLSFLPPGLAEELGNSKKQMDALSASLAEAEKAQTAAKAGANKAKDNLTLAGGKLKDNNFEFQQNFGARDDAYKALVLEEDRLKVANQRLDNEKAAVKEVVSKYKDISKELAAAGFEKMAQALNKSLAEAGVAAAKGYLDIIKSAGGFTSEMDANLTKQQISIQIEDIKARYQGTIALANLTLEVQRNTLATERSSIMSDIREQKGAVSEKQTSQLQILDKGIREIDLAKSISKTGSKGVREYSKIANSEGVTSDIKGAMGLLTDVVAQSFGKDSQLAKLFGDMKNADLQSKAGAISDKAGRDKQPLADAGKRLATEAAEISNLQAINGIYNDQLQKSKEINAEAQIRNKFASEEIDIQSKIDINKLALGSKDPKAVTEAKRNALSLEASFTTTRVEKETQLSVLSSKSLLERKLGTIQLAKLQEDTDRAHRQYILDIKIAEDTTAESKLSYLKEIGGITEAEYIQKSATIKAAAEERKFNEEILVLKKAQSTEQDGILAKIDAANTSLKANKGKDGGELAIIEQQTKLLRDSETTNNNIVTAKTLQNTATTEAIALQTAHNVLIKEQADQMAKMQSITESLSTAFGDVGSAIGKAGEAMLKTSQSLDMIAKREKEMGDVDKDSKDYKKLQADKTKAELSGIGAVAGATKKLFGEKTAAYKVLDGIEKASAVMKFALMAKELAMELGLITASVAGSGVKAAATVAGEAVSMPVKIAGIYASFMSMMGPFGPPAAALAIAAFLGSFAGSGGGGGGGMDPKLMESMTSSSRQGTQGTGMSYDAQGNKVANGGGVFGDTSAKSDSIQNSLDLIAKTSVEGMSYSNEMVDLLTGIKAGIEKLSISLYSSQGISTGTGFGTVEGASGGGGGGFLSGLFGSSSSDTSIIDSGIKLKGTFLDLAHAGENFNAVLGQYETVQTTTTSSGALWGLFGGGGTSSKISESIKDLDSTVRGQIGAIFTNATNLFIVQGKKLGQTESMILSKLGSIDIDKFASLRGLKGAELQKELESVIGGILDDTARTLFPKLDAFKKFGEGYAQTVTRVIDTNEKIGQTFKQLGKPLAKLPEITSKATEKMTDDVAAAQRKYDAAKTKVKTFTPSLLSGGKSYNGADSGDNGFSEPIYSKIDVGSIDDLKQSELELAAARKKVEDANKGSTANNLAFTEDLATAAGGVDRFLALSKSFTDNYLSSVETLQPRLLSFRDHLKELGITTGITKSGIKDLILNYKFTTDATGAVTKESSAYYVKLLELSEAYDSNSAIIGTIADKLGLSTNSIDTLLTNVLKTATSADDARQLATTGFADALGSALQASLISSISTIIYDSVITPMITDLVAGSGVAGLNIVTGGALGGSNLVSGSAVAGTNVATGGAVAGASVAEGGAIAGNNIVAGSAIAGGNIAAAITKVKGFVTSFIAIMSDPEVKSALKGLAGTFGEFAAVAYTGTSAISSFTTSIGGTTKAAIGATSTSSGGSAGGAVGAVNSLVAAWQSVADSIFGEVTRIRDLMTGTGQQALDAAQAKFDSATALARAGDIEAAKELPKLSQALLTTAEANTSTLLDLRRIQGATQSSLEATGIGAVAQYGLTLPSYDVGTNYVSKDQIAMLHEGEAVIPKAYNSPNNELIKEIQSLRQEVANLREVTQTAGEYTKKTSDTLTRVTLGGEAMVIDSTVLAL